MTSATRSARNGTLAVAAAMALHVGWKHYSALKPPVLHTETARCIAASMLKRARYRSEPRISIYPRSTAGRGLSHEMASRLGLVALPNGGYASFEVERRVTTPYDDIAEQVATHPCMGNMR